MDGKASNTALPAAKSNPAGAPAGGISAPTQGRAYPVPTLYSEIVSLTQQPTSVSSLSKRLRRSVEPRRGARRRDLGTRAKYLLLHWHLPEQHPAIFAGKRTEKSQKAVDKKAFSVYNYMYLQECAADGRDLRQYRKGNGQRNERRFVKND